MPKKKQVEKLKKEKESSPLYWTSFDEGSMYTDKYFLGLLEEFRLGIEAGKFLSIAAFRAHKLITPRNWQFIVRRSQKFRHGLELMKDLIYTKRFNLSLDKPEAASLYMRSIKFYDVDGIRHDDKLKERDLNREERLATHKSTLTKEVVSSFSSFGKLTMTNQQGETVLTLEKDDEQL